MVAFADDPPAPVVEEETAAPIDKEAAAASDQKAEDKNTDETNDSAASDEKSAKPTDEKKTADKPKTEEPTPDENAGLADLDKAAQLKVTAENLPDLNDVVDKLDSAIEKGLDKDNQHVCRPDADLGALAAGDVSFGGRARSSARRSAARSALDAGAAVCAERFAARALARRQSVGGTLARWAGCRRCRWAIRTPPSASSRKVIDAPDADAADRAQALALRGTLQSDEKKRAHDFDEAIALVPDKPDYYRVRAQYLYGQDKFEEALVDVDKALKLEPDHAATQELRGLILLGLKRYDDALATFNKASELEPEAVLPYQHRGEVYRQQGDLKKSAEQLTKALEIAPGDAATLLLRANVLYQLNDYDGALKDVETVDQSPAATAGRPLVAGRNLCVDQARRPGDRATGEIGSARAESAAAARTARHVLPHRRRSRARASRPLPRVLKLDPEDYRALRFRGDANLNIGNHAEAVADFDAAVKLNADDEGLLNNFAWVLATSPDDKVRNGKRAIELATKAAEMTTYTVPHILSTLAAAYAETGDFETAKKWSKKAVELGDKDEAREQLRKELASYEAGKPWRESQQEAEKPAAPSANDHTFAPPSVTPAPARTLDF